LESRVGKVEAHLDSVTRQISDLTADVRDLATSIKIQGTQTEDQIKSLLVAVTNASGPRKTDWNTIALAAGVVVTIGIAVLSPLTMQINSNVIGLEKNQSKIEHHLEGPGHLPALSKIESLEKALKELDSRLQRENTIINENFQDKITNLKKELQDFGINGSVLTRERLAIIENKLKTIELYIEKPMK
jgi:hypothetical protein